MRFLQGLFSPMPRPAANNTKPSAHSGPCLGSRLVCGLADPSRWDSLVPNCRAHMVCDIVCVSCRSSRSSSLNFLCVCLRGVALRGSTRLLGGQVLSFEISHTRAIYKRNGSWTRCSLRRGFPTGLLINAASDLAVTRIMPRDVVACCHRNFFTIINASWSFP